MGKRVKAVNEICHGRYGGILPQTVKGLALAYLADYERRRCIVERGEARGRDEPRFRRVNSVVDSVIASVLDMHGINGSAAEVVAEDLKSGVGTRSARSVSMSGCFLSRKNYEHIREDVLWFVARELNLI